MSQEKRKFPLKELLGGLYIALTIGVVIVLGINNQSFSDLFQSFSSFDPFWSVMVVGCMVAYYLLENYTLWYYLKAENQKIGFFSALKTTMIGQYYSALTPFASGGQPVQVYYLHKAGASVGTATSAMTVKLITFNVAMVVTSIVGVIYNFQYFANSVTVALPFAIFGILANLAIVVLFWTMFFNQAFCRKFVHGVITLLGKLRLVKDPQATREKTDGVLADYFVSVTFIKKNPKKMLWLSLTTWVQTLTMMSVSYCIYRAFGFTQQSPILFITLQYVLFIAVSYVPLPGASGAQEFGFMQIFGNILPQDKIFTVMMIWRFFTYIVSIIVGGLIVVGDEVKRLLFRKRPRAT